MPFDTDRRYASGFAAGARHCAAGEGSAVPHGEAAGTVDCRDGQLIDVPMCLEPCVDDRPLTASPESSSCNPLLLMQRTLRCQR